MAEEEGTGEAEGTEEKTEDKEEEKKGPATIEEALAKARVVLDDKGTTMAMVDDDEDKEGADGEGACGGEAGDDEERGGEDWAEEADGEEGGGGRGGGIGGGAGKARGELREERREDEAGRCNQPQRSPRRESAPRTDGSLLSRKRRGGSVASHHASIA